MGPPRHQSAAERFPYAKKRKEKKEEEKRALRSKSCSKNDKPSGKWTYGEARMQFLKYIFDNLCPR